MATEFVLPELGENITSGNVTKVMVSKGDQVAQDQPVIELETDKAVLEVPSTVAGIVQEVRAKEGEALNVGDVVLVLSDGAAAAGGKEAAKPASPPKSGKKEKAAKPVEAAGKKEAPAPKEAKAPAPSEQPKAEAEPAATEQPQPGVEDEPVSSSTQRRGPVPASPSVRRLAREIGVDINNVRGSGAGGRITEEDVKLHSRAQNTDARGAMGGAVATSTVAVSRASVPLPDFARWGEIERADLSGVRRRTAENMANAWLTVPHVTQFDEADITDIEKLRKQYGKVAEQAGGKLTMTAILLKVCAAALKKFPQFNSSIDLENSELIYKKYYNLGVAVDTDRGLLVPVVRDCDTKSLVEISVELTEMAERARNRKTTLEEMQGGTFTISNLGGIGGTGFTPIVNTPEVAILGVSRSQMKPVYVDGQFQPRNMLPLSLSYDHRVIDGADAARFLRWVCQAVEQPFILFMEA